MLLICSALFFLSKGLQKNTVEKLMADTTETQNIEGSNFAEVENNEKVAVEQPNVELKPAAGKDKAGTTEETPNDDIESSTKDGQEQKSTTAQPAKEEPKKETETKAPEPVDNTPNFIIIDTTTKKSIYSGKISFDSKKTVYEYTNEALTDANIKKFIKSTGYVAMIDNLFDYPTMPDKTGKTDWASCGWIFYINGNKASIGSKDYVPKETDIITWKYWKDAIYEK
jgi:hypothetical protein